MLRRARGSMELILTGDTVKDSGKVDFKHSVLVANGQKPYHCNMPILHVAL